MLVNADFSRRAIVTPQQYKWVASPQVGVERVMLDRLGGEEARATSIVRYGRNSSFPRHMHPEGEEILVLSGTFSEGDNHYPALVPAKSPGIVASAVQRRGHHHLCETSTDGTAGQPGRTHRHV